MQRGLIPKPKVKYTAREILLMLESRHAKDVFIPECKDGPTQSVSNYMRADAWVMNKSWAHPCATAYEIKVSRSDFVNDNKWTGYLPLCNQFYFVAPVGIIDLSEVPEQAGLLTVAGKGNGGRLLTKKKAPHRDIALPEDLYRYILMCRVIVDSRTRATFEITREEKAEGWRRWLKEKIENRRLGYQVSKAIQEKVTQVEIENTRLDQTIRKYDRLKEVLDFLGVDPLNWDAERQLRERIESQAKVFDTVLIETIRRAKWALDSALEAVEETEAHNELSLGAEQTEKLDAVSA